MKYIPDYRQFVNEAVNLKAAHLSSAEYQKAKKLKAFDSADWTWNPKSQLYDKVNESLVTEAKFFRLPNKLNAMWELKNSVDYIVGKHSNGDDYNPAEMKIQAPKITSDSNVSSKIITPITETKTN